MNGFILTQHTGPFITGGMNAERTQRTSDYVLVLGSDPLPSLFHTAALSADRTSIRMYWPLSQKIFNQHKLISL